MASRTGPGLREALEWMIAHSYPQHSSACASQDEEADCFCGTTARYQEILALTATEEPGLRAICVVCGLRGHVRATGGTVLTGGHDAPSGHPFTPATDFAEYVRQEARDGE